MATPFLVLGPRNEHSEFYNALKKHLIVVNFTNLANYCRTFVRLKTAMPF